MDKKQCIACNEDINRSALKCRYCAQIQTKAANLPNKPLYNYISFGLLALFLIWISFEIYQFYSYTKTEPVFFIGDSQLHKSKSDKTLNIRCIANIKIEERNSIEDLSLQATFKNMNGNTIDVLHEKIEIKVDASNTLIAMVSGDASANEIEYKTCEISILYSD